MINSTEPADQILSASSRSYGSIINTDSENPAERKPLSRKLKVLTSIAVFYGNITLGCSFNTYDPVITTLQHKYHTDGETISRLFTILTISYLAGALFGGFIYNYVNRQLAVITFLSTMAATMFVTPHCPTMPLLFVSVAILGFCSASYDAGQFVWLIQMMQKDCPPYVQAQHFFYAFGTCMAPVIMTPFLADKKGDNNGDRDDHGDPTNSTTPKRSLDFNISNHQDGLPIPFIGVTSGSESDYDKLLIPFTIVGFMITGAALCQLLLFIFLPYRPPPPEVFQEGSSSNRDEKKAHAESTSSSGVSCCPWSWRKWRIVILCCLFYGFYQGMEMCMFQFFPKFGQNSDLHLSEYEASKALTGLTANFAAGRAIAMILVFVFNVSSQLILWGNLALALIANILLIGWASGSFPILWASGILFGLGFSSIYGSISAYMERYLEFTNFMGGLMIVCGASMASIYPIVAGKFIEQNVLILSYISFFSIGVLFASLSVLSYLTSRDKTRY